MIPALALAVILLGWNVGAHAAEPSASATPAPTTAAVDDGLGAKPPPGAVVLFDGSSIDAWTPLVATKPTKSVIEPDGALIVAGGNLVTKQSFGDFRLHLEFRCPDLPPEVTGQKRGNSGVYFHDRYELQILGYHGPTLPKDNEVGAIYHVKAPAALATKPDGQWQAFDAIFRAPSFDADGKKSRDARLTVHHNGVLIHDDVPIPKPGGGARGEEGPTGPVRLQDKGHKIAFRNIWVVPLNDEK